MTHGVIVGMTGSGKTGLLTVIVEEALRSSVPVLMIDIKGDLPNLLLTFPNLAVDDFAPWVDEVECRRRGQTREEAAEQLARTWRQKLADWELDSNAVSELHARIAPRLFTPGLLAGEPLHVLSSLELPSPLWESDVAAAREALSASISLLLRLIGRDPDPTRSRDHVVLSVSAERRLRAGEKADVASLLGDVRTPPIEALGAFESWRMGAPLDIASWLAPREDGRVPAVIVSVAHLDDDERGLVLGILLDQLLAWVRSLTGTHALRALVVFDEVYGFIPPHPANPPKKQPLVSLMKQARAFGVGMVLATQNPMDLD